MVDRSLAIGATRTALRQLIDESERSVSQNKAQGALRTNDRKARLQILSDIFTNTSRVALHGAFYSDLGYGGAISSIVLIASAEDSACLHHHVIIGVRGSKLVTPLKSLDVDIDAHALQRINERLALLDIDGIRQVFKPASLLLLLLSYACAMSSKELKQISVPLYGGVLRCDINNTIVAKTFVPVPAKWEAGLVSELDAIYASISDDVRSSLLWIPYALDAAMVRRKHNDFILEVLTSFRDVMQKFDAALQEHAWIKEPYTPRPDPIGNAWNNALEARLKDDH